MFKHHLRNAGNARLWVANWVRESGVEATDRARHEVACLADILYHGGVYDQLNAPVLASFETLCR
eukprot:11170106-Lingulodinium_polyedra.AAC.1